VGGYRPVRHNIRSAKTECGDFLHGTIPEWNVRKIASLYFRTPKDVHKLAGFQKPRRFTLRKMKINEDFMITLTLPPKYVNVLQAIGNVQEIAENAIRSYALEKIGERIGKIQHEILKLQAEYGLSYEKFYVYITTDEEFVKNLRKFHPTWEKDFNTWEYCIEELNEWLGYIESISKD